MMYRLLFFIFIGHFLAISCSMKPEKRPASPQMLSGLWKSDENIVFYEQWEKLSDSEMTGIGFGLNHQDTIITERMRIALHDGRWCFFALVASQNSGKEIAFRMVDSTAGRLVFENPDHDYPNRITYDFHTDSSLTARIENMRGNKQKQFKMNRISD